ncbi:hypothetical protein BKA66DRAFT_422476 [Pyrenochaeta sp. MPI-SDFR-AT-0127]|nr:hypothetical protein BKA66DRAFT_422476 [Pyrenochaeta sp. MPI-SDFR-AT-0127]
MTLPENTSLILKFSSRDEARNTALDRTLTWSPPKPDATIPTTPGQRAGYVLRLLLAMRNRDNVLDKARESKHFNAKGAEDMGGGYYYYKAEDMETVCWEIVTLAENLHNHGANVLGIYDRDALSQIKKEIKFTFEERMSLIIKMLCFFKSRCDAIMKGNAMEEAVAYPMLKLVQIMANRVSNDRRAVLLAAGRNVQEGNFKQDHTSNDADAVTEHPIDAAQFLSRCLLDLVVVR